MRSIQLGKPLKDLTGEVFTRLTVIEKIENSSYKGKPEWRCLCSCGEEFIAKHDYLLKGTRKSCGCLKKDLEKQMANRLTIHGKSKHPLYSRWQSILDRCLNPKKAGYSDYGGRGIEICERWANRVTGFLNFLEDMGESYSPGLELDRKDVNGDYCPENCRWVTESVQSFNGRPKKRDLPKGVRKRISSGGNIFYEASIAKDKKKIFIGSFKSPEEAAIAVKEKELELYGENSPSYL